MIVGRIVANRTSAGEEVEGVRSLARWTARAAYVVSGTFVLLVVIVFAFVRYEGHGSLSDPPSIQLAPGFHLSAWHSPAMALYKEPSGTWIPSIGGTGPQPTFWECGWYGFHCQHITFPDGRTGWGVEVNPLYFFVLAALGPLMTLFMRRYRHAVSPPLVVSFWTIFAACCYPFLAMAAEGEKHLVPVAIAMMMAAGAGVPGLLFALLWKKRSSREVTRGEVK